MVYECKKLTAENIEVLNENAEVDFKLNSALSASYLSDLCG
jgi:hypothetical protein